MFIRQISNGHKQISLISFSGGDQVVLSDEARKAKRYRIPPGKTSKRMKLSKYNRKKSRPAIRVDATTGFPAK